MNCLGVAKDGVEKHRVNDEAAPPCAPHLKKKILELPLVHTPLPAANRLLLHCPALVGHTPAHEEGINYPPISSYQNYANLPQLFYCAGISSYIILELKIYDFTYCD